MKFQKSPFPYVITLVSIISISIFSNITVNKNIENPITYSIEKTATDTENNESNQQIAQLKK